jgi:hypothetical protein
MHHYHYAATGDMVKSFIVINNPTGPDHRMGYPPMAGPTGNLETSASTQISMSYAE